MNKYVTSATKSFKQCKILIQPEFYPKLIASNPIQPRLYGLPIIHKSGEQMRIINNSPTYLIVKWLHQ